MVEMLDEKMVDQKDLMKVVPMAYYWVEKMVGPRGEMLVDQKVEKWVMSLAVMMAAQ